MNTLQSANNIEDREGVIRYLTEVKEQLLVKFPDYLTNVYAHGSLINNDGRAFKIFSSDIDLIITTKSLGKIHDRVQFLLELKQSIQKIEDNLKLRIKERRFFPIISVCVVNEFELNDGIHKNRNSSTAYYNFAFRTLDLLRSSNVQIGRRLKEDLVGINFPAWAILTEVQEVRSVFVTPKSSDEESEKEREGFSHQFLPLPKEMLRNAYLFEHYKNNVDEMMIVEDDIAEGFDIIKGMLKRASLTDIFADELYKLVVTNSPWGQNPGSSINWQQILYLWELLSIETEKALEKRRRGLNTETLKLAAPPVILELSRLRKTSLEAVDMAIELYEGKELLQDGLMPVEVLPHKPTAEYEFSEFDKEKLIPLINEWPDDIREYLLRRMDLKVAEGKDCQSKVGFSAVFYSHLGMTPSGFEPRPAYLRVRPLNFWILSQFNLEMAGDPGNNELRMFRDKYGSELFKANFDYKCSCPSGLYVEVAVVSKDGDVIILPKSPKYSQLAQRRGGNSILTCGLENGLSWTTHLVEKENKFWLDVNLALMDGLKKEFLLDKSKVKSFQISTLAIHHAHLNAALLGVVHLKLSTGALLDHFKRGESTHFKNKNIQLISRDKAKAAMHNEVGSGNWHDTALMRINLI